MQTTNIADPYVFWPLVRGSVADPDPVRFWPLDPG